MLELRLPDDGRWVVIGLMREGEPEGSMSSNAEGRREIIRFRLEPDYAVIERSRGGVDFEVGAQRGILSSGFDQLARLYDGEQHELPIQTDRMTEPVTMRFRMLGP